MPEEAAVLPILTHGCLWGVDRSSHCTRMNREEKITAKVWNWSHRVWEHHYVSLAGWLESHRAHCGDTGPQLLTFDPCTTVSRWKQYPVLNAQKVQWLFSRTRKINHSQGGRDASAQTGSRIESRQGSEHQAAFLYPPYVSPRLYIKT